MMVVSPKATRKKENMNDHGTPQPVAGVESGRRANRGITVCGVVGLILGITAVVLSFIPIINNAAAVLGFVGAVLALVGIVGTFRGKRDGKVLAVVAAVLSVLGIVITWAMQQATVDAIDDALGGGTSQQEPSADASDDGGEQAGAASVQDSEGDLRSAHVRLVSAAFSGNDYEGNPTVLVTFEWTNTTDSNASFASTLQASVFQNGHELETAIYMDAPEGYDANSYLAELQPGVTGTVSLGYVLEDSSPVEVQVSDLISFSDDAPMISHTFEL